MARKKDKDSFIVYYEWEEYFADMTDQQLGELMRAVFAYEKRGEPYTGSDPAVRMAMRFIQGSLDRNKDRYEQIRERNRQNIARRYQNSTKTTSGSFGIPEATKATDHDPEHDPDPDHEHDHDPEHDPEQDNAAGAALYPAAAAARENQPENAMAYYLDRFSAQISREAADMLPFYAREMGDEVVKAAIDEAIDNKARSWGYIKAVLMAWQQAGVRNMESLERYRADRRNGGARDGKRNSDAQKGKRHLPGETVLR